MIEPMLCPNRKQSIQAVLAIVLACAVLGNPAVAAEMTTQAALTNMYKGFFDPFKGFGASLVSGGVILLWSLVILHVAYGGIQVASGTIDLFELAMQGVKLTIVASLIMAAMLPQAWFGSMTGMGGAVSLPQAIVWGMQKLVTTAMSAAVASNPNAGGMLKGLQEVQGSTDIASAAMFGGLFEAMFKTLRTLLEVPIWPDQDKASWVPSWLKTFLSLEWGEFASRFIATAYWLGTIFMYLIACGMMVLELLGAVLTTAVAIAFTPLMVPWLLFRPLSFLFDAWLKLILVGSLAFVIGVLMLAGFGSFIDAAVVAIKSVEPNTYLSGPKVALLFLPVFFGSFIFTMLATKINGLASGLITGSGTDGISVKEFARTAIAASSVASAPGTARRQIAGGVRVAASGAAAAGRAAVNAGKAAVGGGKTLSTSMGQASASAGGGARGAAAAVGAGIQGLGSKVATGAGSAVSAVPSKVGQAFAGIGKGESAGMTAAKAVASDSRLAPSRAQLGSAASAANSAINAARLQGMNRTEVATAGHKAARTALTGADKAAKAPASPPAGVSSPQTAPLPKLPTR